MLKFNLLHPAAAAVYFLSVLLITMFISHPAILACSMAGGLLFCLKADPGARHPKFLISYFVFILLIAVTNPLVSHNGVSPLFFLNGSPVTLEAVLYGINMGFMLTAVLFWFKAFNLVVTEDKLLFLTGRFFPKTALLISMALRFVPVMRQKARQIRLAQSANGLFLSDAWTERVRAAVRIYSALISWALEHAVDVGAAMRARGYGKGKRTSYLSYKFKPFDLAVSVIAASADGAVIFAAVSGRLDFSFYPGIVYNLPDTAAAATMILFFVIAFFPFFIELLEGWTWKYCVSRI